MSKDQTKVVFAFNDAISVNGNEFFWATTKGLYEELVKKHGEDFVKILAFGTNHVEVDRVQFEGMVKRQRGHSGGHCMTNVSSFLKGQSFHGDLVIVSDGQGTNVDQAKFEMQQLGKLKSSIVYIIGDKPNSDFAAPFTIQTGSKVFSVNSEGTKLILETEEDERSTFLGIEKMTIEQFLENFDKIYNYITKPYLFGYATHNKTQTIYNNENIRNILMKEKSRLIYEYGKMNKGDSEKILLQCIKESNFDRAKEEINNIVKKYYASVNSESKELSIEEKIDKLIKLCGGESVNNFDRGAVRSNRDKRAKQVKDAKIEDVGEEDIAEAAASALKALIECPLSGEEDIPVLLVTQRDLLSGVAKNVTNEIINCPFELVNYPALKTKVISALGGFVGLRSIKENGIKESPLNGEPIIGGIVLSTQKECVEITKSAIAKMFTNGKLLGAASSYIIAIFEIIKDLPEYEGVVLALKKIIIQLLQTSHSNAAMTGKVSQICLPLRADVSLWFIAHSCMVNIPPANNPFILHLNHMQVLFDILDLLEYPIEEKVRNHHIHFSIVQTLHRMKFINSDTANCFMRALYQKAIFINKNNVREQVKSKEYYLPFVFVDGAADQQQIDLVLSLLNPIFKKVSTQTLISLDTFSHEKWRVEGTELPLDLPEIHPTIANNWNGMSSGEITVDIEKMKKKFIKKYGFEANRDELLLFISRRIKKSTIPNV